MASMDSSGSGAELVFLQPRQEQTTQSLAWLFPLARERVIWVQGGGNKGQGYEGRKGTRVGHDLASSPGAGGKNEAPCAHRSQVRECLWCLGWGEDAGKGQGKSDLSPPRQLPKPTLLAPQLSSPCGTTHQPCSPLARHHFSPPGHNRGSHGPDEKSLLAPD